MGTTKYGDGSDTFYQVFTNCFAKSFLKMYNIKYGVTGSGLDIIG